MKSRRRSHLLLGIGLCICFLFILADLQAQGRHFSASHRYRKGNLDRFARDRNQTWSREHQRALDRSRELNFPVSYVDERGRIVMLQRLGYQNRPVYYVTDNLDLAKIISTNQLWTGEDEQPWLTGEGIGVNLWDGGAVLETHQEFQNLVDPRIRMRDQEVAVSNHSTHVAGTIGAAGMDELAKGMAPRTNITGWDYNNDIAEMAFMALEGIQLSNHSYGSLCGWDFNSSLAHWCWYGDTVMSAQEDYQFGFYDQVSQDLDFIAWSAPDYLIVKSAGNDRQEAPPDQPIEHYIWDEGWKHSTTVRDADGGANGYDCLTPMSVAKNILTVGAVDDEKMITSFSAFGPTDDGRIKPDVVAGGVDVYSSVGTSISSYGTYSGTSMSAASATGSIALLQQLQEQLQPGVALHSSTLKGLLIHTADEMGNAPGPDYQHGWGLLNIMRAAKLLQLNSSSGGHLIREGTLSEGEFLVIPIETTIPVSDLKLTLCWTDPPGSITDPVLNSRESRLVNDLDLKIIETESQQIHLPWSLDPENPGSPAIRMENHADNVEQLLISDVNPGTYQIRVEHSGGLTGGKQNFSLVISGISYPSDINPPSNLQFITGQTNVELRWRSPEEVSPDQYRIYRNDLPLAVSSDTVFMDEDVEVDSAYTYYITCLYEVNGIEYESLGSNRITAIPRTMRALPQMIDFEDGYDEMVIKNSADGWLWGDSDSLSCYYLRFEENSTNFIAANSYTYGRVIHVNDVAATMPLKLGGLSGVIITFDYLFITGIYDAINELNVMYKLPEDPDWYTLEQLPGRSGWTSYTIAVPDEICRDGTQFGFYYDDLYTWGFGAGLDNIAIMGEEIRRVDFGIASMTAPVSDCFLSADEEVIITIKNMGETDALPGDAFTLRMNLSSGTELEEQIVLEDIFPPGEVLEYSWPVNVDLSEPGSYDFEFLLSSDLDYNPLNNYLVNTVEVPGLVEVTILNEDLLFCENDPPLLIQVDPSGGDLSGTGISGQTFDPSEAGTGIHLITYTYTDPIGCTGSASAELEVIASPEPAILNEDLSFCEDDLPVLISVDPSGGVLSGPGISGLLFDPAEAGVGTHLITYTLLDATGCEGAVSVEVVVIPLPEPVIVTQQRRFCKNDLPVQFEVSPLGGILSGPGMNGLTFNPKNAGTGVHECTYTYIDATGCAGSDVITLQVFDNPWIDLGPDREAGLDDTIELEPSGNGTSFLWYNGTTENTLSVFTSEMGTGEHHIWVEALNQDDCGAVDSMILTISSGLGLDDGTHADMRYVYPNPFKEGFYLKLNENEQVEQLFLMRVDGQIVLEEVPSSLPYIDTPGLDPGYYILKVQSTKRNLTFGIIKL